MAGNQDAKNSANSRMHNDVNDPPCAKEEVFRTESKLNDRKIWIIGSIITILFLIATVTGVLVAHFVFDAFHQHVSRHFNMTLSHTTDGIKVNNTARGKVNSGSAGNGHCSQHHDVCAHVGNAFLSASSSYNSGYSAHHGFHGECSSWSSARIYADTEADEWLELRLEKPRQVTRVSFRGDANYPENTPTVYELRAWDLKVGKWRRLMSGSHPASPEPRTHEVCDDHKEIYQQFRLVVQQTGWMETNGVKGYVQMSFVELCWT